MDDDHLMMPPLMMPPPWINSPTTFTLPVVERSFWGKTPTRMSNKTNPPPFTVLEMVLHLLKSTPPRKKFSSSFENDSGLFQGDFPSTIKAEKEPVKIAIRAEQQAPPTCKNDRESKPVNYRQKPVNYCRRRGVKIESLGLKKGKKREKSSKNRSS